MTEPITYPPYTWQVPGSKEPWELAPGEAVVHTDVDLDFDVYDRRTIVSFRELDGTLHARQWVINTSDNYKYQVNNIDQKLDRILLLLEEIVNERVQGQKD